MKNFRKPYLSMFIALIVLFVSCEQYDTLEVESINKFDYSLYNENKNNPILDAITKEMHESRSKYKKSSTIFQQNREMLNIVNSKMRYKLNFSDSVLELAELNSKEILNESLKNKWMTLEDVTLTKSFLSDFKNKGVDIAISNFENRVLKMNLSKKKFNEK